MSDHRALTFSRLGLALALAYCGGAQAQSLQEVYDAARAYDATYLSARALADTAQYKLEQAQSLGRPNVGAAVGSTYQTTTVPSGENPANSLDPAQAAENAQTGAVPNITKINTITSTAGLKGNMALYNPANSATIEQARRQLGVFAADLETAEQDLIVRVAQAYFDVLAAQDTLSTSRANKTAIAEQLASAKRNFEVGTATITDTREAQARYDLAISQDIGADNDLRTKQVVLDQLVGRPGVTPKPLVQPVALPALPSDDIDSWVAQGEQSPLVRKARLGLDVAHLEVDKQRAAGGVTVDASGTVGVQNVHNNLGNFAAAYGAGTTRTASLGLSINYPLYTGGLVHGRVYEAMKLEEKAGTDLEFARRSVSQNTRSAFLGVQSLRAQVKALEAAESSSKLSLEATQLGYKVGVRVNIDVLNAQTQLYTTEAQLAKARYDVLVNGLKLRQANGTLRPDDVSAVNVLLAK